MPAAETGDDLPDLSGDPSDRNFDKGSNKPTALALEDPTAGAAFWPSVLPTCSLCIPPRNAAAEFVFDSTDSVGLPGLSKTGGNSAMGVPITGCASGLLADAADDIRWGSTRMLEGKDVPEPLIALRRRRRSSKGAPLGPKSMLGGRESLGVSMTGERSRSDASRREEMVRADREERSEARVFKNTV